MCEKSIDINDLVRFPYVNDEGDGGWEGTYCSYDCLQTNCFIYDVKEKLFVLYISIINKITQYYNIE